MKIMKIQFKSLFILSIALSSCGKAEEPSNPNAQAVQTQASTPQAVAATPAVSIQDEITNAISEAANLVTPTKPSLTIDDAISMTLASSPDIAKANERVKEYSYYSEIAKKKLFPSIEATAGYSYDEQKNGIQNYAIGFSQNVWDGTYSANIKLNVMRQLAEEQRARTIRRAIVVTTVSKYLNLLKAQGALNSSQAQFDAVKRVYNQVGAAWTLGLVSDQLKYEAEAEYKKGELQLQEAQGKTKVACIDLLVLMGVPEKRFLCTSPEAITPPDFLIPATDDEAIKLALENRPEVAIDAALIESAKAGKALARAEFYPKISVGVQYGVTDSPFSSGFGGGLSPTDGLHEDWALGVTAKIPLFDFGKKKQAQAAAASKVLQAEDDLRSTQRQVTSQVLSDIVNLNTAKQGIATAEAGELAASNLYRESMNAYKLGSLSLTDLLSRVASLSLAQQKTLEAKYNFVQTVINLKTSLGLENQP